MIHHQQRLCNHHYLDKGHCRSCYHRSYSCPRVNSLVLLLLLSFTALKVQPIKAFQYNVARSQLGNKNMRTAPQRRSNLSHHVHTNTFKNLKPMTQMNLPPASISSTTATTLTAAAAVLPSKVTKIMSLLPHQNTFYVLSSILVLSSFGIILEERTTIGKALSAPLATMAMALIIANLGFIPFTSPVYDFTNRILIPLAIPLLLYDSNLRRVISDTGSLLIAFILGSIATAISTIITYKVLPLSKYLGENGWKIGSALAARHIGGAINFVAVSETLNVDNGSIVSAAIAADNVVVAAYFALLFYLAIPGDNGTIKDEEGSNSIGDHDDGMNDQEESMSMQSISVAITVSSCIVTIGKVLTGACLPKGTSALPLISVLTVFGATLFPKFFQSIRSTGTAIGIIFMQMFFAASGAAGSIRLVIESAPSLFVFSALQVALHFICLVSVGRFILKLNPNELYLASNANVGGPTTAAAMATAKNWKRLVLPALLVGILGYASATPIALALGQMLKTIGRV